MGEGMTKMSQSVTYGGKGSMQSVMLQLQQIVYQISNSH